MQTAVAHRFTAQAAYTGECMPQSTKEHQCMAQSIKEHQFMRQTPQHKFKLRSMRMHSVEQLLLSLEHSFMLQSMRKHAPIRAPEHEPAWSGATIHMPEHQFMRRSTIKPCYKSTRYHEPHPCLTDNNTKTSRVQHNTNTTRATQAQQDTSTSTQRSTTRHEHDTTQHNKTRTGLRVVLQHDAFSSADF